MDIASLIGLLAAIGLIVGSIALGSAPFAAFIDMPSSLVVIGGAGAAALICFPLGSMLKSPLVVLKVFFNKSEDRLGLIKQIVELAETARRDGLLALESKVADIQNPLVQTGIQMAVDGSTPDVVEEVLRTEVEAISCRHREGKGIMDQLGRFARAYGMIGTLMGLIMMLQDMSDPSGIGKGMAGSPDHNTLWRDRGQCVLQSVRRKTWPDEPQRNDQPGDCNPRGNGDPVRREPPCD